MSGNYELLRQRASSLFDEAMEIASSVVLDSDNLSITMPSGREVSTQMPNGSEMETADKVSLAMLVATTANVHTKAAILAGIARAEYKNAQEAYKRKYKRNKVGRNEDEREASAVAATEDEADRLAIAETVYSIAEGVESASRVASESARKIMDKLDYIGKSEAREKAGYEQAQPRQTYPEF